MKLKTSELIGAALDYAVAVALGLQIRSQKRDGVHKVAFIAVGDAYNYIWRDTQGWVPSGAYTWSPSTNWAHGGPLVDQFSMWLTPPVANMGEWDAEAYSENGIAGFAISTDRKTALIAICRAVVACKLGDEVEVPDELLEEA